MFLGINSTAQAKNITLFQKLQATHFTLMMIAWGCHWNIVGEGFYANHEFLKELYEKEQDRVDACAERVRALTGKCPYTIQSMSELSFIPEMDNDMTFKTNSVFEVMASSWAAAITKVRDVRSQINDEVDYASASFLDGMLEEMEKEAWMLTSFVEG